MQSFSKQLKSITSYILLDPYHFFKLIFIHTSCGNSNFFSSLFCVLCVVRLPVCSPPPSPYPSGAGGLLCSFSIWAGIPPCVSSAPFTVLHSAGGWKQPCYSPCRWFLIICTLSSYASRLSKCCILNQNKYFYCFTVLLILRYLRYSTLNSQRPQFSGLGKEWGSLCDCPFIWH